MAAAVMVKGDLRSAQAVEPTGPRLGHIAEHRCSACFGLGYVALQRRKEPWAVCKCAYRAMFRQCFGKYRRLGFDMESGRALAIKTRRGHTYYPGIDYRADFWLAAKRVLEAREWQVFVLHKIQGHDWHMCCRVLKLDRGVFFHAVYRLEEQLGKALMERELWPVGKYFKSAGEWRPNTIWEHQTRA